MLVCSLTLNGTQENVLSYVLSTGYGSTLCWSPPRHVCAPVHMHIIVSAPPFLQEIDPLCLCSPHKQFYFSYPNFLVFLSLCLLYPLLALDCHHFILLFSFCFALWGRGGGSGIFSGRKPSVKVYSLLLQLLL